jgi:gluconokinase
MREQEPELFRACEKFISIKEFIWYNLFGIFEVDFSLANATGLFDHRKKIWCDLALDLAGIDATHLSSPVASTHMRTTHNFRIEELNDLPVVIGASDGCMASLGSGVTKPGPATLTIGTSGALRIASPVPVVNFEGMVFSYHLDDQTYICGGAINNGGAALNWYAQELLQLTPSDSQPLLGSMCATAGAEGLVFLPYVFGERAPIWDSKASGVFFGIQSHHRKEHFTRAVVEGITIALSTIGEILESDHALIDSLYVSGGFTRSNEWLQIVADVFNKKVIVTQSEDASAIGAALMAIKVHQSLSDYPMLTSIIANKIVLPDASKYAIYHALRERSKRLYRLLKDEMTLAFDEQRVSNQS